MSNTRPFFKNPHLEGDPFYWEAGRVGVLLIHGFTATTAEIRPLAKGLHAKGYTVSGPLLPGHGTKPEDANRYTWRDWVDMAENAYQQIATQCDYLFVGGESTGALLALYLGEGHPEITGLLTFAPAVQLKYTTFDIIRLYFLAPFIPYIPKNPSKDDLLWQGYTAWPLRGAIQLFRLQRRVNSHLQEIRRPILIVQGRLDNRVHPKAPEIIEQSVSSAVKEIHWMKNSTHCVILDREQDQVIDITLKFIQKVIGIQV